MKIKKCLICGSHDLNKYCDLGKQPLANNLSKKKQKKYELSVNYCCNCFHSQLSEEINKKKLFSKYLYLSSQSKTLSKHFYNSSAKYVKRFNLKKNSLIIDVGSNDGVGLNYYRDKKFQNFFGIEPAKNISALANKNGIKTINSFLNTNIEKKFKNKADLITASNVFAHNKNVKSLGKKLISMLNKNGTLVIEVQYLIKMLNDTSYDNIYHEHIHYWSLNSLNNLFKSLNAGIYNVEIIDTHGGSIRCYIKKNILSLNLKIKKIIKNELKQGIKSKNNYLKFSKKILEHKKNLKIFFKKNIDKKIVGYGAAAKTATLLNFIDLKNNNFSIIDDNPLKQNFYIPGTKNKIVSSKIFNNKNVDILIVFAWNYFSEIKSKVKFAKKIISIRSFF